MKYDEFTEEIKSKTDIVDLISQYIELKRAGQNLKGLCPFHSEKTPSFMVNPAKQIFHCFGCNKGGDIFTFIMNYENMTFSEAVSYLAQRAGIEVSIIPDSSEITKGVKEKMYLINREAMNFYRNNLKKSVTARSYMKERGIMDEVVEKFSLGFTENERNALFNYLKKQGFTGEDIMAAGLAVIYDDKPQDFFRNRIMFPIFDIRGQCIAFGGRTMSSSKEVPKYINSSDSPVFKKSEICYGSNFAKNSIARKGYSIIVEGYFDVIVCHQFGFDNAIAPLGTALTNGQLRKIKRLSDKVLLLFDGDSAGIAAAKRAIEHIFSEAMVSKILLLPDGEDPDTFLRKFGGDYLKNFMSGAKKPVEFILGIFGENRLDGVKYLLSVLSLCPDALLRDEAVRDISEIAKVNEFIIRQELKNSAKKAAKQTQSETGMKDTSPFLDIVNKDEKMLLKIALSFPEHCKRIISSIEPAKIQSPVVKGLFEKITLLYQDKQQLHFEKLYSLCSLDEMQLVTGLLIDSGSGIDSAEDIIEGCIRAIQIRDIEKRISLAAEENDVTFLHTLLGEKSKLLSNKGNIQKDKGNLLP
jgi:DNA primase